MSIFCQCGTFPNTKKENYRILSGDLEFLKSDIQSSIKERKEEMKKIPISELFGVEQNPIKDKIIVDMNTLMEMRRTVDRVDLKDEDKRNIKLAIELALRIANVGLRMFHNQQYLKT